MDDLHAERDYLTKRMLEVREVRRHADAIDAELSAVLVGSPAYGQIPMMRFAAWTEARRARLDAWLEERGTQLDHVDVELFVLAYAPPPPVWLVVWPLPVPWRLFTPWATLGALWDRLGAFVRRVGRP